MLGEDFGVKKIHTINRRMFIIGAAKFIVFAGIIARLFSLQITDNKKYSTLSDKNRLREWKLPPVRGEFLDYFDNVILNEFALIMENFGVPLLDGTISDEEEFIAEGQEKPFQYDLKRIDEEGIQLLEQVAKFLLKEYMHPREFFGKMIKNNHEVKGKKENGDEKVFKVDVLAIKDFYLKVKIANIKKTLAENESLNKELCLDPVVHPTFFNMKTFVRALEDIAEVE